VPHASGLRVGSLSMPKGLKRIYGQGHLHFLTFSCYRRLPLLSTKRARNLFVHALGKIRERYKFLLVGYVVMPEHVHLLISETADCTPSLILKVLKQRVSRDLRRKKRRAPAGQLRFASSTGDSPTRKFDRWGTLPRFWQPRFYDFNVWSAKKRKEKLEYMHRNPITRKLVQHPKDWPWSSWSFYEGGGEGMLPIDPVE
jgi:REP-associated tyrosine transposase